MDMFHSVPLFVAVSSTGCGCSSIQQFLALIWLFSIGQPIVTQTNMFLNDSSHGTLPDYFLGVVYNDNVGTSWISAILRYCSSNAL